MFTFIWVKNLKNQLNKKKSNHEKKLIRIFKKYLVRFSFGFMSLKPKNQTEKNRTKLTKPIRNSKKKNPKNNIVFGFKYKIIEPNRTVPKPNRTKQNQNRSVGFQFLI